MEAYRCVYVEQCVSLCMCKCQTVCVREYWIQNRVCISLSLFPCQSWTVCMCVFYVGLYVCRCATMNVCVRERDRDEGTDVITNCSQGFNLNNNPQCTWGVETARTAPVPHHPSLPERSLGLKVTSELLWKRKALISGLKSASLFCLQSNSMVTRDPENTGGFSTRPNSHLHFHHETERLSPAHMPSYQHHTSHLICYQYVIKYISYNLYII